MKKISTVISGLFIFMILICPVKAEGTGEGQTTINTIKLYTEQSAYNWFQSHNTFICINATGDNCSYSETFNQLYTYYENNLKNDYPYYVVSIEYGFDSNQNIENWMTLYYFRNNNMSFNYGGYPNIIYKYGESNYLYYTIPINGTREIREENNTYYPIFYGSNGGYGQYKMYTLYDANFDIISERDYEIANFYNNNSNVVVNIGDKFPKMKDLLEYTSWSDYENNHLENYTTVNLDNYEYVLLSLKNYNQTTAFQTNLQVKGQIGITPIYNFGQTSKDTITGVQVQDRCNLAYENYTAYPFYIIQSDLQNNAIYAVKECSSGSSFKFDNTIFNVTYITQENEDNPTVTIEGTTYDVIPYDDLPSTATKNEEDNYIPGESGSATDTGGLDSAISSVQKSMSEIWNTFTYFTDFVGQIFSGLPEEVRTILLSAFTITIMIGLIKIFIGK